MTEEEFKATLNVIRESVDSLMRREDGLDSRRLFEQIRNAWRDLTEAGRDHEANQIFQSEALVEMNDALRAMINNNELTSL